MHRRAARADRTRGEPQSHPRSGSEVRVGRGAESDWFVCDLGTSRSFADGDLYFVVRNGRMSRRRTLQPEAREGRHMATRHDKRCAMQSISRHQIQVAPLPR